MKPIWYIVIYIVLASIVSFALFGIDKKRAQNHEWRISEKALFLSAILGGAPGALLGMQVFRHKTQHWYFQIGIPLILVAEIALVVWLGWKVLP